MTSHVLRFAATISLPVALSLWATPAQAVKYMSIEKAVKRFVPRGSKIVKVTKNPTDAQRQQLWTDYGWKANAPKYVFYAGKRADGSYNSFVYLVPEIFGTCFHKYAVGMDADGKVKETVIVELSCPRAFPINKKAFLKQFRKRTYQDPLTLNNDVDGVTGATYSSEATATATRKAVSLHNIFFGGNRPVQISDEVRTARAAVQARIKKAIESGELLTQEQKKAKKK